MRRGVALPRRGASFTPEPRADEMMLGEESFQILMRRSNVAHMYSLAIRKYVVHHEGAKHTKVSENYSFFLRDLRVFAVKISY